MLLHLRSLSLKTWLVFVIAGVLASTVTNYVLRLLSDGTEQSAEATGVVSPASQEQRADTDSLIMLIGELYALPRLYQAVAASRDEAMYRNIVSHGQSKQAKMMVVVVGAAHANGILQRAQMFGL